MTSTLACRGGCRLTLPSSSAATERYSQAARFLAPLGVAAVGVNLGKFGFLAGCVDTECADIIKAALDDAIKPVVRTMLTCCIKRAGRPGGLVTALNDIVVTASVPAQMVGVELYINARPVSSFQGDGLIISSATGSTGYNLSSGGPIVAPQEDVIILTPLAPHTLAIRPLVISGSEAVDVRGLRPAFGPARHRRRPGRPADERRRPHRGATRAVQVSPLRGARLEFLQGRQEQTALGRGTQLCQR